MSRVNKQWMIHNLELPKGGYDFDDYKFQKTADGNTSAFLRDSIAKERPAILWAGSAMRIQDILSLYGFFARKLVCLKEDYGEDEYFWRTPGKGIKFDNPWDKTKKALDYISIWKGKDKSRQEKILAFHFLMAFRYERFEHTKSIFMQTCLKECLKNNLGAKILEKFPGIQKKEFDLINKHWRRIRDCNVHKISFSLDEFLTDKKDDKYQKLSKPEISLFKKNIQNEKEFRQFIKDSFWAFDVLLTYYFASLFRVFSLDNAPNIADKFYSGLKSYCRTSKLNSSSHYKIYCGRIKQ